MAKQASQQSTSEETLERTVSENGIKVTIKSNHLSPGKTNSFFNPKMRQNRELVLCSLATFAGESDGPLECLDAFGATGIMGLQWAKHCNVRVVISDINEESTNLIKHNCRENKMNVKGDDDVSENPCIEVVTCDVNVLMHQRAFDFIHLDPYGTSVQYLEAAFRHIRNNGIISVTSTDTSTLFGKSQNVTARNYGGHLVRTEYFKELGARMVLQAIARAAGRCYKGIEVLLCTAVEHFILVVVRVHRGGKSADKSISQIRQLLHCRMCEERVYFPDVSSVLESNYSLLKCECHNKTPGRTAIQLGPIWGGNIFNVDFIQKMVETANKLPLSYQVKGLLELILDEAICSDKEKIQIIRYNIAEQEQQKLCDEDESVNNGKRALEADQGKGNVEKRMRENSGGGGGDARQEVIFDNQPHFYYNLHKHSQKDMNTPKTQKMVMFLHQHGHRASRTHFDALCVRTSATLPQVIEILQTRGSKTFKLH